MNKSYYIFLTRNCNLACKYCFQHHLKGNMDEKIAYQTEQFILNDSIKADNVQINFFGGEPLLNKKILKLFVERFKYQRNKYQLTFTTNGTLLDEEFLTYCLQNNIHFALSADGKKETHDKNRIFKNGKGSFNAIPFELVAKYFPDTQIIMVVDPSNVNHLTENTWFFANLGFKKIAHNFDYYQDWSLKDLKILALELEDINNIYFKHNCFFYHIMWAQSNIECAHNNVEQTVCGLTQNMCAIDINGDIYPCQEYVLAKEKFIIGNIWDGIDESKREYGLKCKEVLKKPKNADCKNCVFRFKCSGGCGPHSLAVYGDRFVIPENYCRIMNIIIPVGLKALVTKRAFPVFKNNIERKLDRIITILNNTDLIRLEKV